MKYYVYIYKDPITTIPFYVGKGKGDRYTYHLKETKENYKNKRKYDKIQSILNQNLKPIIEFHSYYDDEDHAYDAEEILIKKYGRIDLDENGILTNIAMNSKPSSATLKGKTWEEIYGVKGVKIRREKASKALKGRIQTEEWKRKNSESKKGKTYEEIHGIKEAVRLREIKRNQIPWNKGLKTGPRGPYKKRKQTNE